MSCKRSCRRPAPKIGLLINSIGVFNAEAKDKTEKDLRACFDSLIQADKIHPDSLIRGRIFGPHEAMSIADEFASALVDLVVIANVAFPNGNVFLTLATHPHLAKTPIAILADPETHPTEWSTNAWCGVIMNNFVAKQIGRIITALPGPTDSPDFRCEFDRLLRVAGTIKALRNDYLCRFGDAPGGFHSATGNQLAFAAVFGTRLDTIDLTALMEVYRTGVAKGLCGEKTFSGDDVQKTVAQLKENREIQVDDEMLTRGARLYHSYRAVLRAGGFTSAAIRCWPENNESYIGISACMAMGLLLANGDSTSAGCESDWPTSVAQTMGTLLSGKPAACLDWINYTGGSDIIQLGHCGVGICGQMRPCSEQGRICDIIAHHPPIRQGGGKMGPVHVGQFEYGPKTGICIMQSPEGKMKLLVFRGTSSADTDKDLIYSATDIRVPQYKRLNELILEHGFPHHLAVALDDVSEDLRLLCRFLGVEFISPED